MEAWVQLAAYVGLVLLLVLFGRLALRVFGIVGAKIAESFDLLAKTLARVFDVLTRMERDAERRHKELMGRGGGDE